MRTKFTGKSAKTYLVAMPACLLLCATTQVSAADNMVASAVTASAAVGFKTITSVESVSVKTPEGTAPRLPYMVWVKYSDGTAEYRQVKWSNSAHITEETEADSKINPAGTTYKVKGFIIGDNTTDNGYPIVAEVTVVNEKYAVPSNKPAAETLPLNKVSIDGDNRLTWNRNLDIDQLISLDVKQQLYNYRDTYGLSTEGYPEADGWDSPTTKLKGHGSGHYMSAMAFAFASCQDKAKKDILRKNITQMVNELRECQERTFVWNDKLGRYWEARDFAPEEELRNMKGSWKDFDEYKKDYKNYGYGYLNAIPAEHCALIEMYRAYNNEHWVWAPYYSVHKQLAGLIDIATYIDDKKVAAKALQIAKDMGLWVWNRMHYRTYVKSDGTQEERRSKPGNRYEMWNMYIAGEVGGMSESLARLSEMTNDPTEKAHLLEASNYFDSPAFFEPLSRNVDAIRTRHANQHIPMVTGALRSYRGNNNPYYYNLSQNFWTMIQGRYRYAMGGVGNGEMFRQPYTQILSMCTNVTSDGSRNLYPEPTINETCCAYNMAKLTKDLNCFNPDDAKYMDYYERVLYNQIIGSVNPKHYQTVYQYAVGLNASKPWGNETPQSTCCGGTGVENHVKYQEAAYFVNDNTLWVALYMPTTAQWDAKKVTIKQDCAWPAEKSTIRVTKGKGTFAMKLRVPYWATEGFDVKLNGVSVAQSYTPSSYVEIPARKWTKDDVVEVVMPFTKHLDFGPDKMETAATAKNETKTAFTPMWAGAFMYGPLVMSATGYDDWNAATAEIASDLSDVTLNGAKAGTGAEAYLYTLSFGGKTFIPDYHANRRATHYLRMRLMGDPSAKSKAMLLTKIEESKTYTSNYYTPESYAKLSEALASAEALYTSAEVSEEQANKQIESLDKAASALVSSSTSTDDLQQLIQKAELLSAKDYTSSSYAKLQDEVKNAKAVKDGKKTMQEIEKEEYILSNAISSLEPAASVDKSALQELMQVARGRRDAQNTWNDLTVKVPEYAPWAPNGFTRMMEQYDVAQQILNNPDKNYDQEEVNKTAAALNAAINTMRPGNLPELEDLNELLPLLKKAKESKSASTKSYDDAIKYAEMVVKYVSDGSGTKDMIDKATTQLKAIVK